MAIASETISESVRYPRSSVEGNQPYTIHHQKQSAHCLHSYPQRQRARARALLLAGVLTGGGVHSALPTPPTRNLIEQIRQAPPPNASSAQIQRVQFGTVAISPALKASAAQVTVRNWPPSPALHRTPSISHIAQNQATDLAHASIHVSLGAVSWGRPADIVARRKRTRRVNGFREPIYVQYTKVLAGSFGTPRRRVKAVLLASRRNQLRYSAG